jgi:hypothetical protein
VEEDALYHGIAKGCVNREKVECIGNWLREELIIPSSRGSGGLVTDSEINGSIRIDSYDDLD